MALDPVVNFFRSTIATLPVASGGTSIVITTGDGAKLPDPAVDGAFNLTIYNEDDPFDAPEIVRVTAISGDTLTVTRAQEGTSATNKTSGNTWYLELTPTAKTIQDIDTAKLDVADVVNNLTSTDTSKALSANQGKVLQDGKEPADATILKQANIVDNLTSTSTTAPLSANQGKVLQDGKLNLSGGTMTGDLTIPDKIIHSGDTNTAIRFPANDTVTVETNGTERMRVTSAGLVGIGTNGPNSNLEVIGSNAFFSGGATLDCTAVFIGDGDPATTQTHSRVAITGNSGGTRELYFTQRGKGQSFNAFGCGIRGLAGAGDVRRNILTFFTSDIGQLNLERMRITSTGNVGIGTTAPATKLDVSGRIRGNDFVTDIYSLSIPTATATTILALPTSVATSSRSCGSLFIRDNGGTFQGGFLQFMKFSNGGSAEVVIFNEKKATIQSTTFSVSGTDIQLTHFQGSTRTFTVTVQYLLKEG